MQARTQAQGMLAALALVAGAAAQDGAPLQPLQGDLQGTNPSSGVGWPDLVSPAENPFVASSEDRFFPEPGSSTDKRRLLGKALFWDEQVSADNTMACGTCHAPELGGVDPRGTVAGPSGVHGSLGVAPQDSLLNFIVQAGVVQDRQVTPIAPPSVVSGAAFKSSGLWNGRAGPTFFEADGTTVVLSGAAALEAQAVDPPVSAIEMGHPHLTWDGSGGTASIKAKLDPATPLALASNLPADLAQWLASGGSYAQRFDEAFAGTAFAGTQGVTRERFAMAIATYERTLVPNQAPVDVGLDPMDPKTPAILRGLQLFEDHGCVNCHSDVNQSRSPQDFGLLTSGGFTNPFDNLLSDGRRQLPVGLPGASPFSGSLEGVVTPSLRNVGLRPHFFHNGQLKTLEEVLDFYNKELVAEKPNYAFFPALNEDQKDDVIAFLQALTDPRVASAAPPFDRPTLHSELVPHGSNEQGQATPVDGPNLLAHVPLLSADPHFRIGVHGAVPYSSGAIAFSTGTTSGPGQLITSPFVHTANLSADATGWATFKAGMTPSGLEGITLYAQAYLGGEYSNAAAFTVP